MGLRSLRAATLQVALGCDSASGSAPQVTTYWHPGLGFRLTLTGGWTTETDPTQEQQLKARSTSLGGLLTIAVCPNPKPELRRNSGMELIEDIACGGHPALQTIISGTNPETGKRALTLFEAVYAPKEVYALSISGAEGLRQQTLSIFKNIAASLSIPTH